jgi:uncharacterized membrane protein
MVGSMFGWVLELFFRRFISTKNPERKWLNPGFLMGPALPLYGFGLVSLFVMSLLPYVGHDNIAPFSLGTDQVVIAILAMGLMMTLIEYIAGLIFIKGLKIKLWDYSDEPFNIQGIICLKFSIIWQEPQSIERFTIFISPSKTKNLFLLFEYDIRYRIIFVTFRYIVYYLISNTKCNTIFISR